MSTPLAPWLRPPFVENDSAALMPGRPAIYLSSEDASVALTFTDLDKGEDPAGVGATQVDLSASGGGGGLTSPEDTITISGNEVDVNSPFLGVVGWQTQHYSNLPIHSSAWQFQNGVGSQASGSRQISLCYERFWLPYQHDGGDQDWIGFVVPSFDEWTLGNFEAWAYLAAADGSGFVNFFAVPGDLPHSDWGNNASGSYVEYPLSAQVLDIHSGQGSLGAGTLFGVANTGGSGGSYYSTIDSGTGFAVDDTAYTGATFFSFQLIANFTPA